MSIERRLHSLPITPVHLPIITAPVSYKCIHLQNTSGGEFCSTGVDPYWCVLFRLRHLKGDVIAGITTGLSVLPQGLAYGQIVELPAQVSPRRTCNAIINYIRIRPCSSGVPRLTLFLHGKLELSQWCRQESWLTQVDKRLPLSLGSAAEV